jgi:hypothetical protein
LRNNNLSGSIPSTLGNLTALTCVFVCSMVRLGVLLRL